jgi:hypothetical protein
MEAATVLLFALVGLAAKGAGLFVIVYFAVRLAIRHERGRL